MALKGIPPKLPAPDTPRGGASRNEDDPTSLAQTFEPCDRGESTPGVLAAYIVLEGRHRAAPLAAPEGRT
jgi:hypothetical protein